MKKGNTNDKTQITKFGGKLSYDVEQPTRIMWKGGLGYEAGETMQNPN